MTWVVVDVEADGPVPIQNSMVCFGAVVVEDGDARGFYGRTKPISTVYVPEALAISGFSREEHELFPHPSWTMIQFRDWLRGVKGAGSLTFVSDNPAFDWQWINMYFHQYLGENPFGFSARRIGDLYSGWKGDATKSNEWKKMRKTSHTHHPVDDARGNVEALLEMQRQGLKLPRGVGA